MTFGPDQIYLLEQGLIWPISKQDFGSRIFWEYFLFNIVKRKNDCIFAPDFLDRSK